MNRKSKIELKSSELEVFVSFTGDVKRDRSNFDRALREFKKKIKKSGILSELRRREAYMSPSKYKTWKKNESIKRRKRDERKQEWNQNKTEW